MAKDERHSIMSPDNRPLSEQPRWRRDFPIDLQEDRYIARRDFTKFMVLTSLAFVVGQFWIVVQNFFRRRRGAPPIQRIAAVDDIPVNGIVLFSYPGEHDSCVLIRLDEERFLAYNQKCTHLACSVVPEIEAGTLRCPCHQGFFDLATGRPISGPPQRPLARIKLEFARGAVYASDIELRTS